MESDRARTVKWITGGAFVALLVVIAAFGASNLRAPVGSGETLAPFETLAPLTDEQFWLAMFSGDPSTVTYRSRDARLAEAEVVVVGSAVAVTRGREIPGGPGSRTAYMANVSIRISDLIKGKVVSSVDGVLTLETLAGVSGSFPEAVFDRLVRSRSAEQALLILVSRDGWLRMLNAPAGTPGGGRDLYMVLGGQGVVRNVGGRAVFSPFADWADRGEPTDFLAAVEEFRAAVRP